MTSSLGFHCLQLLTQSLSYKLSFYIHCIRHVSDMARIKHTGIFQKGHTNGHINTVKNSGHSALFTKNHTRHAIIVRESDNNPVTTRQRPHQDLFDARKVTSSLLLPGHLRPSKQKYLDTSTVLRNLQEENGSEYGVLKLQYVAEMVSYFSNIHQLKSPQCQASCYISKERHNGLCLTLSATCNKCKVSSDAVCMFDKLKKQSKNNCGPRAGSLDTAAALACLKTKMGIRDIQYCLAVLDIKPPSKQLLQRKLNKASDAIEKLNKLSMKKNQEFVHDVNISKGQHPQHVHIEVDTGYNNRPHAGCEAGTQAFTPVIENNTNRRLVIECALASKLCNQTNCLHQTCKKNHPSDSSISSAETKLTMENINNINAANILQIVSITSDASCQIKKTCNILGLRFYTCTLHRMRTVQKHIQNMTVSKVPASKLPCSKTIFLRLLAISIRKRCLKEIIRSHRLHRNEAKFVTKAHEAIENIVSCFTGNHKECRKFSLVCQAHLQCFQKSHLPYGKYLNFSVEDKDKLLSTLNKGLSAEHLRQMSRLNNTNKAESMHHRLMTYATKQVTWRRIYFAFCHSAVHSSSLGTGESTMLLAAELGLTYSQNGPLMTFLRQYDNRSRYDSKRQREIKYRKHRYYTNLHRCYRPVRGAGTSLYGSTASPSTSVEHSYGQHV
jgi:hypothetical protein